MGEGRRKLITPKEETTKRKKKEKESKFRKNEKKNMKAEKMVLQLYNKKK